jgi:glycerol-3-phosphate O-acyltransferase
MSIDLPTKLKHYALEGKIPEKYAKLFLQFYQAYKQTLQEHGISMAPHETTFLVFLERVKEQIKAPFAFPPYHRQILEPFDYYQFGLSFIRPLVDEKHSSVFGEEALRQIDEKIERKENVIFFANHQIEADPQAISLLLERKHPKIAKEIICVAGERVLTDPLAIPFSMGRNLLCIYSKRHIDHPPELKPQKQLHNKKTMELMSKLLCEGGHAIYVAPSGGRDRADALGNVQIAPFDPQSLEMFYLMAQKATRPTSFYPMALDTYDLLPPPQTVERELGEERQTKRAEYIWSLVKRDYERLIAHH